MDISVFRKVYYNTIEMLNDRHYNMENFYKNNKLIELSNEQLLNESKIIIKTQDNRKIYF